MSTKNLTMFGTNYTGVTGFKATDTNDQVLAFVVAEGTKTITENGTGIDVTAYAAVDVSVSGGGSTPTLQTKTATPTESQQTIEPDSGYDGLSSVTVAAISSTYVGSGIDQNDSDDLTASGATVTAPAGYYASAASKTVTSGSATTPATTITANPSISVSSGGLITATASATQSVTPTVSAGYVSSGTAGTITVSGSNTEQLSTQGATTYNTSSSDQTISSGKYLTGTQTIKAVTTSGISAANIKYGTTVKVGDSNDDDRITGVTGTFSGSSTVSSGQTAATAAQILSGYSAFVDGVEVQGTATSGAALIVDTLDSHGGTIREITSQETVTLQSAKSITPTTSQQTIYPDTGYDGFASVVVDAASGSATEAEQKKINFIDYDGRILYSYTSAEFAQLSALPDNPTYTDRTGLGWNWTLAQIQTQLSACPQSVIWIGQKTKASDGKTHIKVIIPDDAPSNRLIASIRYTQSTAYGVSIDWGDGSTPESHSTSGSNISHTYAQPGIYDITLSVTDGTLSFIGSSSSGIFGDNTLRYYMDRAKSVIFGNNVSGIDGYTYYNWGGGDNVYIPAIVTGTNGAECSYAYGIRVAIVGDDVTAVTQNMFRYAYGLKRISLPYGITSIGYRAFNYCNNLSDITIPSTVTSIGELAFAYCTGLTSLSIPSGVTSIGAQAFANNPGIGAYHFYSSTPPTLSNSNAFSGISSDTKIYVPSASLNAYKGASNWSTYSSYMEGE